DDAVGDRRAFMGGGGLAVLAREAATARGWVGGGVGDPVSDGVSELAGLGVVEQYRRRGIGAAITSWLAQAAFDNGAEEVFLTPAGEAQERIYGRVGFTPVDEVLYLRRG